MDQRLLRVLAHPLRQRILRELSDRVASPAQLARALEEPLGNVSYHVKTMAELGAVELVRTAPARGAVEHFYRATMRVEIDDKHWARIPLAIRRKLFDQTLQLIWEHSVAAAEQGGFDDPQAHVSWTGLDLDEEGYQEAVAVMAQALEDLMAVQARATGRLAELPAPERAERRSEAVLMLFDRAAADESSSGSGEASG